VLNREAVHRTPSEQFRAGRTASLAVGPFNKKIGAWQRQAALLNGRIRSVHLRPEDLARARAEAGDLSHQIVKNLIELEDVVSELPANVQSNSRIEDTFRAMRQVMSGLRQSLATPPAAAKDHEEAR